jgi:hypothetical protein
MPPLGWPTVQLPGPSIRRRTGLTLLGLLTCGGVAILETTLISPNGEPTDDVGSIRWSGMPQLLGRRDGDDLERPAVTHYHPDTAEESQSGVGPA